MKKLLTLVALVSVAACEKKADTAPAADTAATMSAPADTATMAPDTSAMAPDTAAMAHDTAMARDTAK